MKPYEIIEHTADVGIKAYGATLKELFENAAKGMFEIIGGDKEHKCTPRLRSGQASAQVHKTIEIKKSVEALEELLVDWLSELLYISGKEKILFGNFRILELNNHGVAGEASGEKVNPANTSLQTEIKAVTFHGLKIEEDISGFNCKVIFDV